MNICNAHIRISDDTGSCSACYWQKLHKSSNDIAIKKMLEISMLKGDLSILRQELEKAKEETGNKRIQMVDFASECHVMVDDILGYDTDIKLKDKIKLIGDELAKLKAEKPATQPDYKEGDRVVLNVSNLKQGLKTVLRNSGSTVRLIKPLKGHPKSYRFNICGMDWMVEKEGIKCLAPEQKLPRHKPAVYELDQEETERVWWTAQDYAKRQIVWLKDKDDSRIKKLELLKIAAAQIEGMIYKYCEIPEKFALPDGEELYKGKHG